MPDLRALLDAATPGPWRVEPNGKDWAWTYARDSMVAGSIPADAALIVAAVNALPALLAVLDAAIEAQEVVVYHNFGIPTGWVLAGEKEMDALRAALAAWEEGK